ncbi:MAG: hypothetical protein MK193_05460 [Lentisphaeria bacterium]|nr:hypothetical protein [Lentisphaeria bacterium]
MNLGTACLLIFILGYWAIYKNKKYIQTISFTIMFIAMIYLAVLKSTQSHYSRVNLGLSIKAVVEELRVGNDELVLEAIERYKSENLLNEKLIGSGLGRQLEGLIQKEK